MLPEKLCNLKWLYLKVINSLSEADTCNFKCKAWFFFSNLQIFLFINFTLGILKSGAALTSNLSVYFASLLHKSRIYFRINMYWRRLSTATFNLNILGISRSTVQLEKFYIFVPVWLPEVIPMRSAAENHRDISFAISEF